MSDIKQVHLGLGRFFRGHQAVYTQGCISPEDWGIAAVSLRTDTSVKQMINQDNRYHLLASDKSGTDIEVINSVSRSLFLGEDYEEVMELLVSETTQIVSLTVTEKGYCFDFSRNELDKSNPDIKHDLDNSSKMKSTIGLIAASVIKRFDSHKKPYTLLSCDNVAMNGDVLKKAIAEFLSIKSQTAGEWFQKNISCPNTMVDRIVPRVEASEIAQVSDKLMFEDKIPILTEKFSQWCIENNFSSNRPEWEKSGVEIVEEIGPYENLKLRALNASHSYLTYLGLLKGHSFVDQAIEDKEIKVDIQKLFKEEVADTLEKISPAVFDKYCESLLERFRNPSLKHQLSQIAMDGSQKISQRWVPTILDNLEKDRTPTILFKGISVWLIFVLKACHNKDELFDPMSEKLKLSFSQVRGIDDVLDELRKLELLPEQIIENKNFKKEFDEQYRRFF